MKKILILLILIIFVFIGCNLKKSKITRNDVLNDWDDFSDYVIDIWNCTYGDTYSDVPIPNSLLNKYENRALSDFFTLCYNQVWTEYYNQINSQNWSWFVDQPYYRPAMLYVDLINVSSFPISHINIQVDGIDAPIRLDSEKLLGVPVNASGRFSGQIPYTVFRRAKKASLSAIYYVHGSPDRFIRCLTE